MKTLIYFMLLNILNGIQTKERVEEGNFPEEFSSDGWIETDYLDNESKTWIEDSSRGRSNVMRIIQTVFGYAEIYRRCSTKKVFLNTSQNL